MAGARPIDGACERMRRPAIWRVASVARVLPDCQLSWGAEPRPWYDLNRATTYALNFAAECAATSAGGKRPPIPQRMVPLCGLELRDLDELRLGIDTQMG